MRNFSHLEHVKSVEYDYASNLFSRVLPLRAFTNTITSTFLLGIEQQFVIMINQIRSIKTYFRL